MSEIGVTGLTVTEVKGFGRQKAYRLYRAEYGRFPVYVKVEVVVSTVGGNRHRGDRQIRSHGKDRRRKIFVTSVEQVIRIRTGETKPRCSCSNARAAAGTNHYA